MKHFCKAAAVVVACSILAIGQNKAYQQDAHWRAPDAAVSRANPLADTPDAARGGRKLFLRNCAECHGKDGAGTASKHSADLLLGVVQGQSDGALFWKMTNGNARKGMPSFSRLPELQRWQLVLHIRTPKAAGSAT